MDSVTAPTTIGALLAEENTMDPSTPLPSFLEMVLADATSASGRAALSSSIGAAVASASAVASAAAAPPPSRTGAASNESDPAAAAGGESRRARLKRRLASISAHVGRTYRLELMLLITYAVERSVLAKSCATASESVYAMRRARGTTARRRREVSAAAAGEGGGGGNGTVVELGPLSERDKTRSALMAALAPYVKEKLDGLYERERERRRGREGRTTLRDKLWSAFVSAYPYLHMSHEGTRAAYQFMYLIGRSAYYCPSLHALGIVVRRVTQADLQQQQQQSRTKARAALGNSSAASAKSALTSTATTSSSSTITRVDATIRALRTAVLVGLASVLVTGWVAHLRNELRQRRRRWIAGGDDTGRSTEIAATSMSTRGRTADAAVASSDGRSRSTSSGDGGPWAAQTFTIPPPQPPKLLDPSTSDVVRNLPNDKALCPICHRRRVNPAAATSGHVFCYRCIVMHVRERGGRCPLTGMPCLESNIVRLYEPTGQRQRQQQQQQQENRTNAESGDAPARA